MEGKQKNSIGGLLTLKVHIWPGSRRDAPVCLKVAPYLTLDKGASLTVISGKNVDGEQV